MGHFPEERMTEMVDSLLRDWRPIIKHLYLQSESTTHEEQEC